MSTGATPETRRVLVVDDERGVLLGMKIALRTDGWEVVAASHAREAEHAFAERPADVVVLDYMLPETDGLALAHVWRRAGVMAPILLVSAESDGAVVWRALKHGIIDMLPKPMEPDQLRRRVAAMHARAREGATRCSEILNTNDVGARLRRGLWCLQRQQPKEALACWDGLKVTDHPRTLALMHAFALQLAQAPGAREALAEAGWPVGWHLSGGPDIFLEYCRRTGPLLG